MVVPTAELSRSELSSPAKAPVGFRPRLERGELNIHGRRYFKVARPVKRDVRRSRGKRVATELKFTLCVAWKVTLIQVLRFGAEAVKSERLSTTLDSGS